MRRRNVGLMWLGLLVSGIGLFSGTGAAQNNPIVIENQQPGTSQWQIPGGSVANDTLGQIKGYASATSVNKGENITLHISVNPAQTYTIDVYRMGWYQGLGGRLIQHIGPLNGLPQPTCPIDAVTGLIECRWAPAFTLATQTSWTSGIYLALLTNAQNFKNYIVFVVRDDNRVAPLLYQQPVTTYQAYNDYPLDNRTGKSLYDFNSFGPTTILGAKNAAKVSFDRPYLGDGAGRSVWDHSVFQWEVFFVRWMEKSGYDVTYSTDVDTHTNGQRLLNYRGLIVAGHDEYWSKPMYDAIFAARDAGVNLAFFGANVNGWQIRFEPSSSGVPNRVIVCYRIASFDPVTDMSLKTVTWRSPTLNRPEQTLVGIQFGSQLAGPSYPAYVVKNSGNWVYAGTGFRDGDSVPGILGYEVDRLYTNLAQPNALAGTYTLLSDSPVGGGEPNANSSVYQAQSGAWVFAAGTLNWTWALDNYGGFNLADARIQRTTANVLNRFLGPDFSLNASPSSRTVAPGGSTSYGITISAASGFTGAVSLSVSGLPSGANASFAPNPTTASSTLSVTASAGTPAGTYPLTITGVSGNLTHSTTVSLVVSTVVSAPPDFTLSVSPSSQSVVPGGSTSYSVTITPTGGFTGLVTLSTSGLPSGTGGSFSSNPATLSSVLSVTTSTGTAPGTYTVTITGVSGNLTHTTAIALTVATTSSDSPNNVLNPGFENGLSPWTTYGVATVVTSPVASGQYAAQIQANSGVFQQISGLLPNTKYILTAQARAEFAGSTVWVGVKNHGGPEQYQGIASTSYTPANVTFTTGPSSTSALIYLWLSPGVSGRAWGDDYAVVPATVGSYTLAASPSSVASGGTITANWTAPAGQTATTDWIGLYAMGTPNTSPLSSASTGGATSGSLNFTAPTTSGTFELRYLSSDYTSRATSNAVTVTATAPLGPPNKVLNPGFENGLSPWTAYGAATLVTSPVAGGQYAAQVEAFSGVFQQVNGLLPNTTYVLTARARVEVAGSTVWVGVKNHGGPEQYQGIVSTSYTPANVTFTTGPSSTSALIYLWLNAGTLGRGWGDDYTVSGP